MVLELTILSKDKTVLAHAIQEDEVSLSYEGVYNPGDQIVLRSSQKDTYLKIRLDDSMETSYIYLKELEYTFFIPFEDQRKPYGKKAFTEERHWAYASVVDSRELENYRNLAYNPYDTNNNTSIYPHAETNVTTDNPQFFARNAIDGIFETRKHGSWPYSSWGINRQKNASLKIDFGKEVWASQIILYLRADFPHDNWWNKGKITFSDGTCINIVLKKSGLAQKFSFPEKKTRWILLSELQMSDEASPFPALSQIMVMGTYI